MSYSYPANSADWWGASHIEKIYLFELDAFSLTVSGDGAGCYADDAFASDAYVGAVAPTAGEGITRLRYASSPYVTTSTDTPASTVYEPRLEAVRISWRIPGARFVGVATHFSEVELANGDGGLDSILADYEVVGRSFRLLAGEASFTRDENEVVSAPDTEFVTIMRGTVTTAARSPDTLRFTLADGLDTFRQDIVRHTYAGTGETEGGIDLKEKRTALTFGFAQNVTGTLVDDSALAYDVHDEAEMFDLIPAVYDRGIALTAETTGSPTAGKYYSVVEVPSGKKRGQFRLGGAPTGTVTANVKGEKVHATSYAKVQYILPAILTRAGLTANATDMSTLAGTSDVGAVSDIGLHIPAGAVVTPENLANQIMDTCHAVGWFDPSTFEFRAKYLPFPAAAGGQSITDAQIVAIDRIELPPELDPAVFRVIVNYDRNWTPQNDLADTVSGPRRSFSENEWRSISREAGGVVSRRKSAKELIVNSLWVSNRAYCEWFAGELLYRWSEGRALYRITGGMELAVSRTPGALVEVTNSRYALSAKPGYVVDYQMDTSRGQVEMWVVT